MVLSWDGQPILDIGNFFRVKSCFVEESVVAFYLKGKVKIEI